MSGWRINTWSQCIGSMLVLYRVSLQITSMMHGTIQLSVAVTQYPRLSRERFPSLHTFSPWLTASIAF